MKYYKYLDLKSDHVSEKLKSYYLENEEFFKTFWTNVNMRIVHHRFPELQELFDPLGIKIKTVAFVKTDKPITDIHMDYTEYSSRINLPVLNCELTETKFYITDKQPDKRLLPNGITYLSYKEEDCTQVDSMCLSCATVVRVTSLHQVCSNNINFPRVSCTIGFDQDIEYLYHM